jgi:cytochrome c5
MKLRILALVALAACLNSCSPKVVAMQPSDPAVPQMPSPPKEGTAARIAEGKGLYEQRCGNCHKLFSPTNFSQTEWAPILIRMQPKARFDDEQMALVRDYVYSLATP